MGEHNLSHVKNVVLKVRPYLPLHLYRAICGLHMTFNISLSIEALTVEVHLRGGRADTENGNAMKKEIDSVLTSEDGSPGPRQQ